MFEKRFWSWKIHGSSNPSWAADVTNVVVFQMGSASQHHEPMVAMICPDKTGDKLGKLYHNQYMNADGKWTTDFDHKATCRTDKVEILEYCKKVYPDKDINNIVEYNHYTKIGGWCKLGRTKCKGPSRWVKPFRCLGKRSNCMQNSNKHMVMVFPPSWSSWSLSKRCASGSRALPLWPHSQPDQMLGFWSVEQNGLHCLSGAWHESQKLRHASPMRHRCLLWSRIRLLPFHQGSC